MKIVIPIDPWFAEEVLVVRGGSKSAIIGTGVTLPRTIRAKRLRLSSHNSLYSETEHPTLSFRIVRKK